MDKSSFGFKSIKKFHRYLVEPRLHLGSIIIAGLPTDGWLGLYFPTSACKPS
jgi:hypothetical protein